MLYRKATAADAEAFADIRTEFVTVIRVIADVPAFRAATLEYFNEHIRKGDLLVYFALDGEDIIGSCMLCIYDGAPKPSCIAGRWGELLNVYTKKPYRRQGHAEALIRMLMDEAREMGVSRITLSYTADGHPLYKRLGFTELDDEMAIKL